MMPSYVNIGARVGRGTDGRHVGDGRVVRPDRSQRAPVRRRRHRRRARAAEAAPVMVGDECLIGSRCMVAEGARVGDGRARRGLHPHRVHPGDRRLDRRGGRPGRGAAVDRGRGGHPAAHVPGRHEFGLPCVLVIKQLDEGGATTRARSTTSCATTAPRCDRDGVGRARRRSGDLLALTAELVDIPSESHPRRPSPTARSRAGRRRARG